MKMKILVLTDIHSELTMVEKFVDLIKNEKFDLLLLAGDLTDFGPISEARYVLELLSEANIPFLYVPGNCDLPEVCNIQDFEKCCIHGKQVEAKDITIIGIGGSTFTPFNTPFEMSEEVIYNILENTCYEKKLGKFTILLSHSPPFGILDKISNGKHVGSRALREFIEKKDIDVVVSGHIHEARGKEKLGKTLIVNPGPAFAGYYGIITIEDEIKVELHRL
jgi:hypothetical protein